MPKKAKNTGRKSCPTAALVFASAASMVVMAGCGGEATELMVVVDTDLSVPTELDAVDLLVTGPSGEETAFSVPLAGAGAVELPLLLGLVPSSERLDPVEVRATGLLGTTTVVERSIRTGFVRGEVRVVRLLLLSNCVGHVCGTDQTCGEDGCIAIAVPGAALPPWEGRPGRFDSGAEIVDGGDMDATLPDGGPDGGPGCDPGTADCDGMPGNGCEADLSSTTSCGDCTTVCSGDTPLCSDDGAGSFECISSCTPPASTLCGGSCVDTNTSTSHCGRCDNPCPDPPNASPRCSSGSCGFSCDSGFDDCDSMGGSGCETSLTTLTDCGDCGTACSRAHATATCSTRMCRLDTCNSGWDNCDSDFGNGCETSVRTLTDCGDCGTTCSRANAAAECSTGSCRIDSCNGGWGNCDGIYPNGCETRLNTLSNCGGCRTTCSRANAIATCSTGMCRLDTCNSGWGNCDGSFTNGCETDLNSSNEHCNMCGMACIAPAVCRDGTCT